MKVNGMNIAGASGVGLETAFSVRGGDRTDPPPGEFGGALREAESPPRSSESKPPSPERSTREVKGTEPNARPTKLDSERSVEDGEFVGREGEVDSLQIDLSTDDSSSSNAQTSSPPTSETGANIAAQNPYSLMLQAGVGLTSAVAQLPQIAATPQPNSELTAHVELLADSAYNARSQVNVLNLDSLSMVSGVPNQSTSAESAVMAQQSVLAGAGLPNATSGDITGESNLENSLYRAGHSGGSTPLGMEAPVDLVSEIATEIERLFLKSSEPPVVIQNPKVIGSLVAEKSTSVEGEFPLFSGKDELTGQPNILDQVGIAESSLSTGNRVSVSQVVDTKASIDAATESELQTSHAIENKDLALTPQGATTISPLATTAFSSENSTLVDSASRSKNNGARVLDVSESDISMQTAVVSTTSRSEFEEFADGEAESPESSNKDPQIGNPALIQSDVKTEFESAVNRIEKTTDLTSQSRGTELREEMVRTVSKQIDQILVNSVRNEVVVRLSPESLGSITVTLRRAIDAYEANVTATEEPVREALRQGRPDIIQHFETKGIGVLKVHVAGETPSEQGSSRSDGSFSQGNFGSPSSSYTSNSGQQSRQDSVYRISEPSLTSSAQSGVRTFFGRDSQKIDLVI